MAEVFLARQPIFTRTLGVAGYELLFRSGEASRAGDFDRAQRLVRGAGDLYSRP
jgi:c-di-GMP-related signal transduction protein